LIVEDDVVLRAMLAELLEDEGFNVHTASNGFSGLRFATEHRPNLILLDLTLPELSGTEVLRELRGDQHAREMAIVIVTGNADALTERQKTEVDAVVRKPFELNHFLATVHRAVQRASTRAAEVAPVAPVAPSHKGSRARRTAGARHTRGRKL
jgi:DNA-binding response OmpR family regulator